MHNHKGYDLDFLNNEGITPLECAVNDWVFEKVVILKQCGAKLDKGVHRNPLLLIALNNQDYAMCSYLTRFNNYDNPDIDGIDINFRDSEFFWQAAILNHAILEKAYLNYLMNVFIEDARGSEPAF